MANSANTGSTLSFPSGKNKTSTAISTNIIITIDGGSHIGAIQTLTVNEKRAVKMIDEIGTDGHIDSVPHQSTNITGTCQRVRFDAARIAQAFGRGFIHVGSQAYPFDIVIYDRSRQDPGSQITTVIKNVWITGIDVTYSATDWVIVENMTWEAETIYSYMGTSNNPAVPDLSDVRPIAHSKITQEQMADRGLNAKRGALDVDGLIDLGTTGDLF
jgi:hypothetical protein